MGMERQQNGAAKQRRYLDAKFPEYSTEEKDRIIASNGLMQILLRDVVRPSVARRAAEHGITGADNQMSLQRAGQKGCKALIVSGGQKADYDARFVSIRAEAVSKMLPLAAGITGPTLDALGQDVYYGGLPILIAQQASSPQTQQG